MKHVKIDLQTAESGNYILKPIPGQVICEFDPIPEAKEYAETFMKLYNKFPNGFESWRETYFEVVSAIRDEWRKDFPQGKVKEYHSQEGTCALYNLAEELTNKFEELNAGREWDGEFFDEIEEFCKKELYED